MRRPHPRRRLPAGVERVDQPVNVRDRHGQLGMPDQPDRIDRRHALAKRKQDALLSVARERQPTVGDTEPRRSGGPIEPVRAGDRHPADVGPRRQQSPRAVLGDHVLAIDLYPGPLGCDAKRPRREAVGGSKAEIEALHGLTVRAPTIHRRVLS